MSDKDVEGMMRHAFGADYLNTSNYDRLMKKYLSMVKSDGLEGWISVTGRSWPEVKKVAESFARSPKDIAWDQIVGDSPRMNGKFGQDFLGLKKREDCDPHFRRLERIARMLDRSGIAYTQGIDRVILMIYASLFRAYRSLELDIVEGLTYHIAYRVLATDPMQGIGVNMGTIAFDRVEFALWKTAKDIMSEKMRKDLGSANMFAFWSRVVAFGCPSNVTKCDAAAFAEAVKKGPMSIPFLIVYTLEIIKEMLPDYFKCVKAGQMMCLNILTPGDRQVLDKALQETKEWWQKNVKGGLLSKSKVKKIVSRFHLPAADFRREMAKLGSDYGLE